MPCNASYTRFIFLESFHIYYNLICIFLYALLFAQNFILEKNGCYIAKADAKQDIYHGNMSDEERDLL
jgi:hypothetical protein